MPKGFTPHKIYLFSTSATKRVLEPKVDFSVSSFMDRSFEQIRTEVLELDHESQRRLVDEVEERLGPYEPNDAGFEEAYDRLHAYDRGDMTALSVEESMDSVRKLIADKKQKRP